jgi:anti-sigma regulatory factor (Ser/Thr protein kinase)
MADFVADISAEPEAISALTERATAFLADAGVDERAAHHIALVLDELLTNVAMHGAAPDAPASVRLAVLPDRISAEVFDSGAMFDPRPPRNVDVSADVGERPVGGLGLMLVHRVTGGLDYERIGDRNRTTFWVSRMPAV